MTETRKFVSRSYYPCTAQELYDWHKRDGALERLIPPWEDTTVILQKGGISPGAHVKMKMHAGCIPYTWHARHVEDVPGVMFRDIQERGPFQSWSHTHSFTDTQDGAQLEDRIDYALPAQSYLPKFVLSNIEGTLQRIFTHRQAKLQDDLLVHQKYSKKSMNILVTGASGVLGQALIPFLTTGGHKVWKLVRRKPDHLKNEIYWNPEKGVIDTFPFPYIDGVIHLAGEYIGLGRWTAEKKRKIVESRTKGTELIARTLASLPNPPEVFLSASAVGYYGDCGSVSITEEQPSGDDFISEVCHLWEEAARPAQDAGIRTVLMRIGVVLTPRGGALERFVSSSRLGLISRIGTGNQYMSWLSIDDMISSILHTLYSRNLEGPVNFTAPKPVTNIQLLKTLSKIIGRPLMPAIPVLILKTIYGQMASEILLSGCQVSCRKLTESGYCFRHPTLEDSLRNLLGKT